MASKGGKESVEVDGRTIRFTHADKVLYEATGTTKADVLEYYLAVAPLLMTYAGRRPVTRKRWPDGTDDKSFFEKNLPSHAPDWVPRVAIEHSSRTVRYPVLDSPATLAWFAQQAALELHVPQWTLENDEPGRTRRIVIDLDPGEGVDLDTTAKVALRVRDLLSEAGLDSFPVTSGSKGIHLYARLDKAVTAASASKVAKQIAQSLAKQTPDLVTATMKRSIRDGKVFVDWSQNSGAKTTVAPYSLRGRAEPWVAAPRSWEELGDGGLAHLHWDEVLKRLDSDGDLLDGLEGPGSGSGKKKPATTSAAKKAPAKKTGSDNGKSSASSASRAKKSGSGTKSSSSSDDEDPEPADTDSTDDDTTHSTDVEGCDAEPASTDAVVTSLAEYRRKRDRRNTPEPFEGEVETDREDVDGPIFVIQEHHARRLHFDLRLEHHGVLASWAVPKNLPTEPKDRRLAVNTEDHPLGYETFEGTIPKGEYGAGHMTIWDRGWYECEKWRSDEIIVWLHGDKVSGRYVLVRTSAEKNQWIVQFMKDQSPNSFYGGRDNPKSSYPEGDKRAKGSDAKRSGAKSSGAKRSGGSAKASDSGSNSGTDSGGRPDTPPLPMIPTAAEVTALPEDKWAFEGKWDGYRVTVATSGAGGQARLVSRNGNSMDWLSDGFPGLADALERPAVIDAELVVLGSDGVPDFASLAKQAAAEGSDSSLPPVELFVFDVLQVDGVDLQSQAWERRREVLELLTPALEGVDRVHVPAVLDGPGDRALAEAEEVGWEGIVAKRRNSRYESGRRSKAWLKQKLLTTTEAVVGGWKPGKGGRSGSLGSLLLGLPAEKGLTYIGRVGTGFSEKQARALLDELGPLARKTSPFVEQLPADARRDAIWVLPKLVVEVRHQGFTDDGHMRQSAWRDIRRDKLPGDL
ncbi:UNVERIFIED_ORG: bifunctional non-homologous end joining protein LigD [Dietzia maris]|uniref:ATP-dependent DNA ligase n=1 Tax=Dietzia maris TaxID=37915 RepID=UPI00104D7FBE